MRRRLPLPLLAAVVMLAAGCGASSPTVVGPVPRPASAFVESVGVNTHVTYFDTAYADWPRVLAALTRLGVHHVRDGIFGNPAPQWAAWNARYVADVEAAVASGIRFDFVAGRPQNPSGTIPQLVAMAATRLRNATESLEGPNEYDTSGDSNWAAALRDYQRELYAAVRSNPALRAVPVLAPSLGSKRQGDVGSVAGASDLGNVHLYTGGEAPTHQRVEEALGLAAIVAGPRPAIVTETGFHNALHATVGQPPVPEGVAAVYLLRTLLEHFADGIPRTYVYELLDEKPDPGLLDPEQHFGLLRNDFSEKPAFVALRDLLVLMGSARPPARLSPLRVRLSGDPVRALLLERADGVHVLALWTEDSLWDTGARRALAPPVRNVQAAFPPGVRVREYRPAAGLRGVTLPLRDGVAHLRLPPDPVVLLVAPGGAARSGR